MLVRQAGEIDILEDNEIMFFKTIFFSPSPTDIHSNVLEVVDGNVETSTSTADSDSINRKSSIVAPIQADVSTVTNNEDGTIEVVFSDSDAQSVVIGANAVDSEIDDDNGASKGIPIQLSLPSTRIVFAKPVPEASFHIKELPPLPSSEGVPGFKKAEFRFPEGHYYRFTG